jgi:YD repeat-containing protein
MYKLKTRSKVLASFLLLLFAGCGDNEVITTENPTPQKQIQKIDSDSENYIDFSYFEGKLVKYESIARASVLTSILLKYDGQKFPQTENYKSLNEELLKTYFYDADNKLVKMEFEFKDDQNNYIPEGYVKYYYDNNGTLLKTEQYNTQDQDLFYTEYQFDASNNISEKKFYTQNGLSFIATYTYDDKINPMYYLKNWLLYEGSMCPNNTTGVITTYYDGSFQNSNVVTSYNYDADGYPTSRTIVLNDSTTFVDTYEYQ